MELTQLNKIGEWNPQLFRELKGQLQRRNLFIVITVSLLCQFLLLITFFERNCSGEVCTEGYWHTRWQFLFNAFNWILPSVLLLGGVYLLISDLGKEQQRGTLNFIRLSPQPSQSILTGKLLGVPALVYLGIVLALPLHIWSALHESIPLPWLLGIYTLWGAGCSLFYCTALLIALLNHAKSGVQTQAWAGSLLACLLGLPCVGVIATSFDVYQQGGFGSWQWLWFSLGQQPGLAYIWTMITVSVGTYWMWQAANRLFRNPNATLISKQQSYGLVCSVQVWLVGFVLPALASSSSDEGMALGGFFLFALNPIGLLVLNAALSVRRQTLQDWARYRHKSYADHRSSLNWSLVRDLIWGEKSPALLAIAINLVIIATIWIPWILLSPQQVWREGFHPYQAVLGLLVTGNLILIYAAICELMVFMKPLARSLMLIGLASSLSGLPLLVIWSIVGTKSLQLPVVWLFSPVPILALANASATTIFFGLLAQFGVLGLLTLKLVRQLNQAGASTSKTLFTGQQSLNSRSEQ